MKRNHIRLLAALAGILLLAPACSSMKAGVSQEARCAVYDARGGKVMNLDAPCASRFSEGRLPMRKAPPRYGIVDSGGQLALPMEHGFAMALGEGLFAVGDDGPRLLWKGGEFIGDPEGYDDIDPFAEGLARVRRGERCGFIDPAGELALPLVFPACRGGEPRFHEGLCAMQGAEGKWGFIDKEGSFIVPPRYDEVRPFSGGLAAVKKDGLWGYADREGRAVAEAQFLEAGDFAGGLACVFTRRDGGLLKSDGTWLREPSAAPEEIFGCVAAAEGPVLAVMGGRMGFLDRSGRLAIPYLFSRAYPFSEGLAAARLEGKWGFIDEDGDFVIPPIYDEVESFSGGRAVVARDGGCGIVDRKGIELLKPGPERIVLVSGGLALVQEKGLYGYVDLEGKTLVPAIYEDLLADGEGAKGGFSEGLCPAKREGRYGAIDKSGAMVIPPVFGTMGDFSGGFAVVGTGERYGYVDGKGCWAVLPRYGQAGKFCEGLAAVLDKGRWGFINKKGGMAVSPRFQGAFPFSEGLAAVLLEGRWGYIDRKGNLAIAPGDWDTAGPFRDGAALVTKGGRSGLIDREGGILVPLSLDGPGQSFEKPAPPGPTPPPACLLVSPSGKKGVPGEDGEFIIPAEYDDINLREGFFELTREGKKGIAGSSGEIIVPVLYDACEYLGEGMWQGCR